MISSADQQLLTIFYLTVHSNSINYLQQNMIKDRLDFDRIFFFNVEEIERKR